MSVKGDNLHIGSKYASLRLGRRRVGLDGSIEFVPGAVRQIDTAGKARIDAQLN